MSRVTIDDTILTNIADAIRTKTGDSDYYNVCDMDDAIRNITSSEDVIDAMEFNNNFPDKYNCGCKLPNEEMLVIDATSEEGMAEFNNRYPDLASIFTYRTEQSSFYYLQLEFRDFNTANLQEEYIVEGIDFTNFSKVTVGHKEPVAPITIIFRNCKFPHWNFGYPIEKPLSWIKFDHCTFTGTLAGGGFDFEWCFIENKDGDGINPASFVHGKNFYIHNYLSKDGYGAHVDGVQLFGNQNNRDDTIHDVSFENYRCELIPLKFKGNLSSVNDPIMIQVEFSGCQDISFKHCYINGGASSVDINNKNKSLKIDDVRVTDVHVGALRIYTLIKQDFAYLFDEFSNITNLKLNNIRETVQAYCGSVWKEDGNPYDIHLSLTNHTNQDRKLIAVTEDGVTHLSISKCMTYGDIIEDVTTLEEFPFDVDTIVTTNGSSFIDVYDAGDNGIQKGRNLIPLKKFRFNDMIKVENIEHPFETFTDGSAIYYDLLANQTVTPGNTNYKLKYSSSDENIANVVNGYLIIRSVGECVITITAGNHYKKEIPISISEITYDIPQEVFRGSYFGTTDFYLTDKYPYFIADISNGQKILINSSEPLKCHVSSNDRISVTSGSKLYVYNEGTNSWDLKTEYEADEVIFVSRFEESEFMYCNYDICSNYGPRFKKNYDTFNEEALRMRQDNN